MEKTIAKITSIVYFIAFLIFLYYHIINPAKTTTALIVPALPLIVSLILGSFGFLGLEITSTAKAYIYVTLVVTFILILVGIWVTLSNQFAGEGGMGFGIIVFVAIVILAVSQLVGLVSLIDPLIQYLKK